MEVGSHPTEHREHIPAHLIVWGNLPTLLSWEPSVPKAPQAEPAALGFGTKNSFSGPFAAGLHLPDLLRPGH